MLGFKADQLSCRTTGERAAGKKNEADAETTPHAYVSKRGLSRATA